MWQVCYVNKKKKVYIDGKHVSRLERLAILAAINENVFPVIGWIRKLNGTWEFDSQGPYKGIYNENPKE